MPEADIDSRLARIEAQLSELIADVGYLKGRVDSTQLLIKWVIFPMLLIVAGLVGVKLTLPA